jgi:hypothetical protein
MNLHKYKVGQSVQYVARGIGSNRTFKVMKLLPAEGDECQYRIKSAGETHERVAKQRDLKSALWVVWVVWALLSNNSRDELREEENLFKEWPATSKHTFTRLLARILQEHGAFTVRMKLYNHLKADEFAGGEEIADSIETASAMIGGIANEFNIPQPSISIDIIMENFRDGIRH